MNDCQHTTLFPSQTNYTVKNNNKCVFFLSIKIQLEEQQQNQICKLIVYFDIA